MKFSINKKNLYNSLIEHNKVVPLRTTLPILSCVVLIVKKESLTLKSSDLEQTIISNQKIKTEKEGSVALPISKLLEIVSVLKDETIKFSCNEDFLVEINSNQGVYKITGKTSEDFPETPSPQVKQSVKINGGDFINIIDKTGYASSKDDLKPALCGVYFNFKDNKITAVATDGHKLVKHEQEVSEKTTTPLSIVLPLKFLNIVKTITEDKEDVVVKIGENHAQTEQKNFTLITRTIKEAFPDFNSVIPDNNKTVAEVNTQEIVDCLKRVSIFSNKTTKQTILSFSTKGVMLSAQDIETSTSAKEHLDCVFTGDEITTSYNAKYLIEVVQHLGGKETNIYLNSALTAAVFQTKENKEKEKTTSLLMPIRINQ